MNALVPRWSQFIQIMSAVVLPHAPFLYPVPSRQGFVSDQIDDITKAEPVKSGMAAYVKRPGFFCPESSSSISRNVRNMMAVINEDNYAFHRALRIRQWVAEVCLDLRIGSVHIGKNSATDP